MTLEQQLRDNLKAAADALIVPDPRGAPLSTPPRTWARGFGLALAGAAAVVVLAIPALFVWDGDEIDRGGGVPTTVAPTIPSTVPATVTTSPPTTSPTVPENEALLGTVVADEVEFVLSAEQAGDEEPLPATVLLRAVPRRSTEPAQEVIVGKEGGFFWHTLTGDDPVCGLTAEAGDDGIDVTVEILLSPSLGCSDPFLFELRSGELVPRDQTPEDLARRFVTAWQEGDEDAMARFAEAEALSAAQEVGTPTDPVFDRCEGAAGSVYCTWDDGERALTIRVRTQPPAMVIEVRAEPST